MAMLNNQMVTCEDICPIIYQTISGPVYLSTMISVKAECHGISMGLVFFADVCNVYWSVGIHGRYMVGTHIGNQIWHWKVIPFRSNEDVG